LLCIEGNIPIIGSMEDGNASDKTINHQVLNDVAKHMRTHGVEEEAFIYIADSAMVSEPNLAQAGLFITRLPATYNEHERVIMEAVEEDDQWYTISRIAHTKPTKNRPGAEYRVQDRSVTLYGQSYRAIVVHSSAHDQRRQKRLDRDIQHSLKEAKALAKAAEKRLYLCRPDAEEAAIELLARRRTYHRFEVTVDALPKYARGRPKNGQEKQPVRFEYRLRVRITENEQAIAQGRLVAGCFVMLTNVPDQDDPKGYSAEQVLRTYKEQHGIERNFGFLKDDQIVNALFLERPERIEALGLVLLISLLIWRLLEHVMRQSLKMNDDTVPGWDNKPTDRPTAYMLTWKFKGIMVLSIDGERMLARPLNDTQQAFLNALHLTETCFTQVPGSG
jgi:transposase